MKHLIVFFVFCFVSSILCGPGEVTPVKRAVATNIACPPTAEEMASAIPMNFVFNSTSGKYELGACDGRSDSTLVKDGSFYTKFPGNSVGKAFFRMGSNTYVCSGSIADGKHVWTAGHCVYGPGFLGTGYATTWCFVPGYVDGIIPYKGYVANTIYYPKKWGEGVIQGFMEYDFALVRFSNGDFEQFTPFDLSLNNDYSRTTYYSEGYPAGAPFNGQFNNICKSLGCARDSNQVLKETVGINCDSTGGCSGGPWLVEQNGEWKISGVNSYGYTTNPGVLYSPYFDDDVRTFRTLVQMD